MPDPIVDNTQKSPVDLEAEARRARLMGSINTPTSTFGAVKEQRVPETGNYIKVPQSASVGIARQTEHMGIAKPKTSSYYGGRESLSSDEIAQAIPRPGRQLYRGKTPLEKDNEDATDFSRTVAESLGGGKPMEFKDIKSEAKSLGAWARYKFPSELSLIIANETQESREGATPFSGEWFDARPESSGQIGDQITTVAEGLKDIALRVDIDFEYGDEGQRVQFGVKADELKQYADETMEKYKRAGVRDGWLGEENRSMIHVMGDAGKSVSEFLGITYAMGGNVSAGVAYFSAVTKLDSYQEAIDQGVSHEVAMQSSDVKALSTAVFSSIGGKMLWKALSSPSKSIVAQFAKGAVAEGVVQEAPEGMSHVMIDMFFGIGDRNWWDVAKAGYQGAVIGGLTGGAMSAGGKSVQDSRLHGKTLSPSFQSKSAGYLAQGLVDQRASDVSQANAEFEKNNPESLFAPDQNPVLTVLDEVLDILKVQGEVMEDSLIPEEQGGPITEPGKEALKVRKEASKLIEAFIKMEGVEPVMSAEQKAQFEADTVAKLSEMTQAEHKLGSDAAVADIDVKIKKVSEKMKAVEARGEALVMKESAKQDSDAFIDDEFDDSADIELTTKESEAVAKQYEQLVTELELLEESKAGIAEKTGLIEDTVLEKQTISTKLGNIVRMRSNESVMSLTKGMKAGAVLEGKRQREISTAVNKVIDTLPISKAGKDSLKKSVPSIVRASDLQVAMNTLVIRAANTFKNETVEKSNEQSEKLIKKHKPLESGGKGNIAKVNTLFGDMSKMTQEEATRITALSEEEFAEEFGERFGDSEYSDMLKRYASIKSQGNKSGLVESVSFTDALQFLVDKNYLPTEFSVERQAEIEESIRKASTGELLAESELQAIDGSFSNPIKATIALLKNFANFSTITYHTMLGKVGLQNDKIFNTEKNEIKARQYVFNRSMRLQEAMAKVGLTSKDLKSWDDPKSRNSHEHIESLTEDQVDSWITDADTIKTSKAIAKKYSKDKSKENEDAIDSAESVEDIQAIVAETGIMESKTKDTMTKAMAVTKWAQLQDPDTRSDAMDPMGVDAFTQSRIDALERTVGIKEQAYVNEVFDIMTETADDIAPVWEKSYGVIMPRIAKYIPRRKIAPKAEAGPIDTGSIDTFAEVSYIGEITPGFKKSRRSNKYGLKDVSINKLLEDYMRDAAWFIHLGEQSKAQSVVMEDPDFQNYIRQQLGDKGFKTFHDSVKQFQYKGGKGEMEQDNDLTRWAVGAFSRFVLAFNPQVGMKQVSSHFAFMEDIPTEYYMANLPKVIANTGKYKDMLRDHPSIKHRSEHIGSEYEIAKGTKKLGFYGEKDFIGDMSMMFGKLGDVTAIIWGGGVMYDYLTQVDGKTHEEALELVASKIESSQQSSLKTHSTPMQQNSNSMVKAVTMFKSAPIAQLNMIGKAYRKYKSGETTKQQFAKSVFIYNTLIPVIVKWMASGFAADDEELMMSAVMGNSSGVPYAGDGLAFVANLAVEEATGKKIKSYPLGSENPMEAFVMESVSMGKDMKKYYDGEDISEADVLGSLFDVIGFLTKTGAGSIFDIGEGAVGAVEYGEMEDFMRLMNYGEGTIKAAKDKD